MLAELCAQHVVLILALDGDDCAVLAEGDGYGVHGRGMRAAEQCELRRRTYADGERAPHADVLAHVADDQGGMIGQGFAVRRRQGFKAVRVEENPPNVVLNLLGLGVIQHGGGYGLRETVELLVSRHKIRLTVDLRQGGVMPVNRDRDQTLTGVATLQLRRLRPAVLLCLFPQPCFSLE